MAAADRDRQAVGHSSSAGVNRHSRREAAASRGVVEARAFLLAPRSDQIVASRGFSLARPAPSADALGGVAALRGGVRQMGVELSDWLEALGREGAARGRCGA